LPLVPPNIAYYVEARALLAAGTGHPQRKKVSDTFSEAVAN
jgi:hypothetical protein